MSKGEVHLGLLPHGNMINIFVEHNRGMVFDSAGAWSRRGFGRCAWLRSPCDHLSIGRLACRCFDVEAAVWHHRRYGWWTHRYGQTHFACAEQLALSPFQPPQQPGDVCLACMCTGGYWLVLSEAVLHLRLHQQLYLPDDTCSADFKQQNEFLGTPLQLCVEEVTLALELGASPLDAIRSEHRRQSPARCWWQRFEKHGHNLQRHPASPVPAQCIRTPRQTLVDNRCIHPAAARHLASTVAPGLFPHGSLRCRHCHASTATSGAGRRDAATCAARSTGG